MKWVKASERLPEKLGYYSCKLQSVSLVFWIDKKNGCIVNNVGNLIPIEIWGEVLWLDESDTESELREQVRKLREGVLRISNYANAGKTVTTVDSHISSMCKQLLTETE